MDGHARADGGSVHDFDSDRPQTKKRTTTTSSSKDNRGSVGRRSQVVNTNLKNKTGSL